MHGNCGDAIGPSRHRQDVGPRNNSATHGNYRDALGPDPLRSLRLHRTTADEACQGFAGAADGRNGSFSTRAFVPAVEVIRKRPACKQANVIVACATVSTQYPRNRPCMQVADDGSSCAPTTAASVYELRNPFANPGDSRVGLRPCVGAATRSAYGIAKIGKMALCLGTSDPEARGED